MFPLPIPTLLNWILSHVLSFLPVGSFLTGSKPPRVPSLGNSSGFISTVTHSVKPSALPELIYPLKICSTGALAPNMAGSGNGGSSKEVIKVQINNKSRALGTLSSMRKGACKQG